MNKKNERELIPLEQVLQDMYDNESHLQQQARSYYYIHYATKEEKRRMDLEDKFWDIIRTLLNVGVVIVAISMLLHYLF